MSLDGFQPERGDRSRLSMDDRYILENQIIPTAIRWLDKPGLREHGLRTLAHWGEALPPRHQGGAS